MNILKKFWQFFIGLFVGIIGFITLFRKDSSRESHAIRRENEDALEPIKRNLEKLEKEAEKIEKELEEEKKKPKKLNEEEVKDYWDKKLK